MENIIFVSNTVSQQIECWILQKNYQLYLLHIIKIKGQPQPLLYNKKKKILYVGIRPDNRITLFQIKKNKKPYIIQEELISSPANYLSFDKKKEILFCACYHGNLFNIFILNKDGLIVKKIKEQNYISGCHAIKINNTNKILFATALKADSLFIYNYFESTEKKIYFNLLKKIKLIKNSGPRHIVFHPYVSFLYIINEINGTISTFSLTEIPFKINLIQSISLIPAIYKKKPWSSEIHIHPNGNYLYACDRNNHIISLFKINKEKKYILTFCISYNTEKQPRSFCLNKTGTYLIVAGELSNTLIIYKINLKTGFLYKKRTQPTGIGTTWITIS